MSQEFIQRLLRTLMDVATCLKFYIINFYYLYEIWSKRYRKKDKMIWVIGGTKDSRDFLEKFVKYNDDIIVSTATEYGAKLIENLPVKTSSEKMDDLYLLLF